MLCTKVNLTAFIKEVCRDALDVFWWVCQSQILEKLEIDESQERNIELSKRADDLVVNLKRQSLIELVRRYPGYPLSHDFDLVVSAFDTEECFGEALSDGAVGHPLGVQALAQQNVLVLDLQTLMLREVSKERHKAEGIIQVA